MAQLRQATELDPWRFGFATVHKIDNLVIGLCGFAGPPDSDRLVEIAYSIAPNYQGKGYATEEATALVDYAFNSNQVKTIRAHTLAEFSPSTRVLEKCGFKKSGRYFIRKITSSGVGKKPCQDRRQTNDDPASGFVIRQSRHILKRSPR
jgi:RimJ/RimL family protein N-acetyltransferase